MPAQAIRKPYDGKRHRISLSFLDENGEPLPSMTEQNHKDGVDINNLIRLYDKTGLLDHVNQMQSSYGDFTEINEYQDNLNMVIQAKAGFAELPSNIRKRFNNDPGEFLEFVSNPDNEDEMISLGLATAPPQDDPPSTNAPPADPPADPPAEPPADP